MKKILIVEDELAYIKLIRGELEKKGYTVIEANNGEVGLAKAKEMHPDLIILDVRMPVMDGITMLDELRKDSYGKSAKVILLTVMDPDDRILKKVIEDKPSYYLIKSDIKIGALLDKIEDLFSEKKSEN